MLQQLQKQAAELLKGTVKETSMLALVAGQRHQVSLWKTYAQQITELLRLGLPAMCKTHKPKDEPHLQQMCDGILRGHNGDLIREFPFMRWGSTFTKPDWSAEGLCFWIELKYVRKKAGIRQISGAIAEDITKYGDNQRRVLYVVYDPEHLVIDEKAFAEPIVRREEMQVVFIR